MRESEMENRALSAVARARSDLVLDHPFFGSIALRMTLRCDDSCRDLWTDGRTLAFSPLYAASVSRRTLASAVAHEVLHVALGHHTRRAGRNEKIWNRACDYAVNCLLVDAGFELPEGAPYRKEYDRKSVDEIYAFLARLQDDESHRADTESSEGEETSAPEGSGGESLGGEGAESETLAGREKEEAPGEGPEEERGGRPSADVKGRERDASHDFSGEVRDHPLAGEGDGTDGARAEQESEIAVMQAAQDALRMGDMPGAILRMLRRRAKPALCWQDILALFIQQCSDSDFTWTVPDRRYVWQDLYLPSRRESRLPEIVLAIDCSGSVDESLLTRFAAELEGILDACEATLSVLYHDVRVTGHEEFRREDMPLRLSVTGGGGTDYRPVTEKIDELGLEPACLLWFTDMECTRFPEEPPYPVLWICGAAAGREPPFGSVLNVF